MLSKGHTSFVNKKTGFWKCGLQPMEGPHVAFDCLAAEEVGQTASINR